MPWVPVLTGVGILAGYMVYAIALSTAAAPSSQTPQVPPQAGESAGPTPLPTASPDGGVERPDPALYPAQDSPSAEPPTTEPPNEPPRSPEVVGKYRVVEKFRDEFVAKVVLANTSGEPQDWTVELAFGSDVGYLNEFWVDGAQQPTLTREDDRYVFTSSVPVEAGGWLALKVHLDRSGWELEPALCTVNGAACSIAG